MPDQPTFADLDYACKKRKTRREVFLERMDRLIPWGQLEERIRPHYPTAGRGRRPYPLSTMLRVHCVQLFYIRRTQDTIGAAKSGIREQSIWNLSGR